MKRFDWYRGAYRSLGLLPLARLQFQKRFGARQEFNKLTSKMLAQPVYARSHSSDLSVFDQIFVEREYQCLDKVRNVRLILDCGANVGYSSAYFLSKFPESYVIAVEPDADNFRMLEKNLAPFKGRFEAIQAAVWPFPEKLQFSKSFSGRGEEWARTVEKASPAEPASETVDTIDMPSLIKRSRFDRVSILKVDIEGAERELFANNSAQWMGKVDNIVIELHGEECSKAFFDAIKPYDFDISRSGELTVGLKRDTSGN